MSERETPGLPIRWIELAVAVFGPLLGIAVGWWLSAQTTRDEALRADRRDAYASMVAVSADCGRGALIGRGQDLTADVVSDPRFADTFGSPEGLALLEEFATPPSLYRECFARLQGARATVTMLAEDGDVASAAKHLESAAMNMLVGSGEHPTETIGDDFVGYESALADFETAARADAREPVSLVPESLTQLVVVLGVLLGPLAMHAILQRAERRLEETTEKVLGKPSSPDE